jgi:hypothetical protein
MKNFQLNTTPRTPLNYATPDFLDFRYPDNTRYWNTQGLHLRWRADPVSSCTGHDLHRRTGFLQETRHRDGLNQLGLIQLPEGLLLREPDGSRFVHERRKEGC